MADEFDDEPDLGKELNYSRPLDIHKWSDHAEVNIFVNGIYELHFKGRKEDIKKKHVKVLLLHLYVTWAEDPNLKTALERSNNAYKARSRYNELHISRLIVNVADTLEEFGLIETHKGFKDRREAGRGRVMRIWPTEALLEQFRNARFSPLDIGQSNDRLAVILRSDDETEGGRKNQIEYDDTDQTREMEGMLARYNGLLRNAFIDIPTLGDIRNLGGDGGHESLVSLHNKFVRRIFNRGSFECGGRFYGAWWQNCPKEWRPKIFINDKPTTELDYSGFHVVIAYALKNVAYWGDIGNDPYEIEELPFLIDAKRRRSAVKSLMLVLLNAGSKKKAFNAFRAKAGVGTPEKRLKNAELELAYKCLVAKHPIISEFFNADAGIQLMNLDSKITAKILDAFTDKGVPALSIHDSYIVQCGYEDWLQDLMNKAFEDVLGVALLRPIPQLRIQERAVHKQPIEEAQERLQDIENDLLAWMPYEQVKGYFDERGDQMMQRAYPDRSERYRHMLSQFNKWKRENGEDI